MSYKEESFFKEMLINEYIYFASKIKIVRLMKMNSPM